jgi:hypothetical protein
MVKETQNDWLDRLFDAARADAPALPERLRHAVDQDAVRIQAGFPAPGRIAPANTGWRGLWAALGGWGAGATLASAAVAGLALGLTEIGSAVVLGDMVSVTEAATDTDMSVFGGYAAFLEEG